MHMRKLSSLALLTVSLLALAPQSFAAITGTIIDSDAKPIAGAAIRAYAAEDAASLHARVISGKIEREPIASVQSADDGTFSIDVKGTQAVDLVIEAPGHAPMPVATVDGDDLGALTLAPPTKRRVRLTRAGKSVPNAIVVSGREVLKTDASGEVPVLGGATIFAFHPDYAVGLHRENPSVAPPDLYEVALTPGVTLRGRVVNAAGPVAHAIVSIDGWALAESADDGAFTIAHAPENWQSVTAVRGNEIGAAARKPGSPEIRLGTGATFTGNVRETKNGGAVAGARMTLTTRDDPSVSMLAVSDAKGKFTFGPLLPRAYQINGMHPVFVIEQASITEPQTATRAISAQPFARARGRVIDEEKKGVRGAIVTASPLSGTRALAVVTNAAGEFALRLAPSSPTFPTPVFASKRDYAQGAAAPRLYQPGETRDDVLITLAHGFVARVKVVDQQRQPVPHVFVNLTPTDAMGTQRFTGPLACADPNVDCRRTGADGTLSLRATDGTYDAFLVADDIAPKRVPRQRLTSAAATLEFQVDRGVTIIGHVLHPDRSPVSDASVELTAMVPRIVTTGADGAFTLTGIASGPSTVTAFSTDRWLTSGPMMVTAPAKDVTITMPAGSRVEGRVTDRSTQQPITDFAVALPPSTGRVPYGATPDARPIHSDDGRYSIDNVSPKTTRIVVRAAGYLPGSRGDLAIEDGKTVTGVDIQLDRGATVSGRVVSSGAPLAGVAVQVMGSNGPADGAAASTDADGHFTLDSVTEGDRTIQFQKMGFVTLRKSLTVTAGKESQLDVDLDHGREVHGRVVDRSGRGVALVYVSMNNAGSQTSRISAMTDGDGAFLIQGLSDGRYEMSARRDGFVSASLSDVAVPQDRSITLTLDNGATITGRVTGLKPEELAQVDVVASGGMTRNQTNVDANGAFTLQGMPDGRVRVDAMLMSSANRRMAATKTIVVENGTAPVVELNFDEGITIRGHVTRAGVALQSGNVIFIPKTPAPDRQAATAMIASDGSYIASGLATGDYNVRVNGSMLFYQTTYTVGGAATFDIDMRGASLHGRVVDSANGTPLANVQVTVKSPLPAFGTAATDSDGRFAIDALADAAYELRAAREPYAMATQQIVVSGGTVPDVEIKLDQAPAVFFHVTDSATGAPIDANLAISTPDRKIVAQASRIDSGEYKAWLQPGSYSVSLYAIYYVSAMTSFTTPPTEVRLSAVHGGRLEIVAKSAQLVRIDQIGPRFPGPIHEGVNGPYPAVAPGSYTLSVLDNKGSVVSSVPVSIVAGQTTTTQLR
jgi:protocatechuate 3,4-dioxygenase beta subunit